MEEDTFKPEKIQHFISAKAKGNDLFVVLTVYMETSALEAVGQIRRIPAAGGDLDCPLTTADPLQSLWTSPAGHFWIAASNGCIWTTAPVAWTGFEDEAKVAANDPATSWRKTKLPPLPTGATPVATAIWGTDDNNVVVGTFEGGVYQWNGSAFRHHAGEIKGAINSIHGSGPDNMFAVGYKGTILHGNGKGWRAIPCPPDADDDPVLTGVRVLPTGEALVCSTSGYLLRGTADGFELFGHFPRSFYGVGLIDERIILAGGEQGALELIGKEVVVLRDTFAAVGISEVGVFADNPTLAFFEPVQKGPRVVTYQPREPKAWRARGMG